MSPIPDAILNFNVDRHIDPWVPPNRVSRLPTPISRFLGYRQTPAKDPPVLIQWVSTFIGAFTGILLAGAIYKYAPGITSKNPPMIVASLGASAVLDYNTIKSPLAQPRNAIFGHAVSAICGVAISKLFQLNDGFGNIQWVAAAMACAVANLLMSVTSTVHPPGGATAVLAATDPTAIAMGWWFIPIVMVGSLVMLAVALLVNNILRQYPVYWWTPGVVGWRARHPEAAKKQDEEKAEANAEAKEDGKAEEQSSEEQGSDASSDRTLRREQSHIHSEGGIENIVLLPHKAQLPLHLELSEEETRVLKNLQERLREYGEGK